MIHLIILVSIVSAAIGSPPPPSPGVGIAGGRPNDITDAPYQVVLLFDYWTVGTYSQYCGGAIIDRKVIVTVARCTNGTIPSQWRIRAGSTSTNAGGQLIPVSRIVQHSGFNFRFDNDISLIILASPLTLTTTVALAKLPKQGDKIDEGAIGSVTGWGLSNPGSSGQLRKLYTLMINQQACSAIYYTFNQITDRMACAGRLDGGISSCEGDAGAPLIVKGVLVGLASWGDACGQPSRPAVYTRLSSFINWIDTNV